MVHFGGAMPYQMWKALIANATAKMEASINAMSLITYT